MSPVIAGVGGTAGLGGEATTFGGGEGTTTTVYLLNSSNGFRNSTRSLEAFFSTMAHLTPFNSSNSWFLFIAIENVEQMNKEL